MSTAPATPSYRGVTISLCPDGPMLVRGEMTILDAEGREIPRNRSTVALCRCGKSALAPFCDGSHKLLRRPGAAAEE